MISEKQLAITLSKLIGFEDPKQSFEQYPTDPNIAAKILYKAFSRGEIEGKTVADFGCGFGVLGIGALLLGAKKVYFVDVDKKAIAQCKKNVDQFSFDGEVVYLNEEMLDVAIQVDVVIMNPPFGTTTNTADRTFLEKAMQSAEIIYSFHKSSTKEFIENYVEQGGFEIIEVDDFDFPLKSMYKHHKKKVEKIKVSCFYSIVNIQKT